MRESEGFGGFGQDPEKPIFSNRLHDELKARYGIEESVFVAGTLPEEVIKKILEDVCGADRVTQSRIMGGLLDRSTIERFLFDAILDLVTDQKIINPILIMLPGKIIVESGKKPVQVKEFGFLEKENRFHVQTSEDIIPITKASWTEARPKNSVLETDKRYPYERRLLSITTEEDDDNELIYDALGQYTTDGGLKADAIAIVDRRAFQLSVSGLRERIDALVGDIENEGLDVRVTPGMAQFRLLKVEGSPIVARNDIVRTMLTVRDRFTDILVSIGLLDARGEAVNTMTKELPSELLRFAIVMIGDEKKIADVVKAMREAFFGTTTIFKEEQVYLPQPKKKKKS